MLVNVLSKTLVASSIRVRSRLMHLHQVRQHLLLEILIVVRLAGSFPLIILFLLLDMGLRLEEQISQE